MQALLRGRKRDRVAWRRVRRVRAVLRSKAVAALTRQRYVVAKVSGFEIRPTGMGFRGRTQAPVPASFYVLDRAYCHRVVDAFDAHGASKVNGDSFRRKRLAEERAAELNREHERWLAS